jgi:hypothetical protein
MNMETAIDLMPLALLPREVRGAYASHRIELLRRKIESATDLLEVHRAQGAIAELRRFADLDKEAIAAMKEQANAAIGYDYFG